jgi:hypothetical protein
LRSGTKRIKRQSFAIPDRRQRLVALKLLFAITANAAVAPALTLIEVTALTRITAVTDCFVCSEQFTVKEIEVFQIADQTAFPANPDCRAALRAKSIRTVNEH